MKQVRWCLDEGDVSGLHSGAILWVPNSVKIALLAIAAHLLFPVRGVELSGVLDVHESSDSDDAKVQKVGFLAVKHFEWRLPLVSAFFGVLFLNFAAGLNSSPHMDDGKPLSASMYRTMVHRALPTRSNTPRLCGVLVARKYLVLLVSKQYCRNSS